MEATQRIVYAVDIGSIKSGNFGWVRSGMAGSGSGDIDFQEQEGEQGTCIDALVRALDQDFRRGCPVAIGIEAPLSVPVPHESTKIGLSREGEGQHPIFAGAGSAVALYGLHQLAYILGALRGHAERYPPTLDLSKWLYRDGPSLLLWEAFISGEAKPGRQITDARLDNSHVADARVAVQAFCNRVGGAERGEAVSDVSTVRPFSIAGAVLLWAGWSEDLNLLHESVFVAKA